MRISDLSRKAGVPIATIKFYLRERLLPPGEPTHRNQARYGEAHLRRLHLIRAFANIAHLDLSSVRILLNAIENGQIALPALYEVLNDTLATPDNPVPDPPTPDEVESVHAARTHVDALIAGRHWNVHPDAPSRTDLTQVIATLRRLGCDCSEEFFAAYAGAADQLTQLQVGLIDPDRPDRAAAVARAVLLEVAFAAMLRMAQEHHVGRAHAAPTTTAQP